MAPSRPVRVGDVLTIALERATLVLAIGAIGARRGPPSEARTLYRDLSQSEPAAAAALPQAES